MRFVVTQRRHVPNTVVGTIEADSLAHAADIARVLWGSFWVVEWRYAPIDDRAEALWQDMVSDRRSLAAAK